MFPTLLKELMAGLKQNQEQNLKKGFEKCGICPYEKKKLLDRLPGNQDVDKEAIGDSFLEQLDNKRAEYLTTGGPTRKRTKIQVPAGKSITVQDVEAAIAESEVKKPSTSKKNLKGSLGSKTKKKRKVSTSSEEDDVEIVLESDGVSDTFSDIEEILKENSHKTVQLSPTAQPEQLKPEDFAVDNFVLVKYNGQMYPGKIVSVAESGPTVECMEKRLKSWRWPEKVDCMTYPWDDVFSKIKPPTIISKRNQFAVPELDNFHSF